MKRLMMLLMITMLFSHCSKDVVVEDIPDEEEDEVISVFDGDSIIRNKLTHLDYDALLSVKVGLDSGTSEAQAAYDRLIVNCNNLVAQPLEDVTTGLLPPSGNPQDFYCIGQYSWPDTAAGATPSDPWIRLDGKKNSAANSNDYDLRKFNSMITRVKWLTLAWFYSGDTIYSDKAAAIIRAWFINSATRMNPHLEYAAALPGVYDGHVTGIIFAESLIDWLDYVNILGLSESWDESDHDQLRPWFTEFIHWLRFSPFGQEEAAGRNNHGSWHTAQVAAYAAYTNNTDLLVTMIEKGKLQLEQQLAKSHDNFPDGSLPKEMIRNQSYQYSIYGLYAFTSIAGSAALADIDFWNYQTPGGKSMRLAFDFLSPYLREPDTWQWESLTKPKNLATDGLHMVRRAYKEFQTNDLLNTAEYLTSISAEDYWRTWLTGVNDLNPDH